jgi:hypothetical protein
MQNLSILLYTAREDIKPGCSSIIYYYTVNNTPYAVTLFTALCDEEHSAEYYQGLLRESCEYAAMAYMMKGENGE